MPLGTEADLGPGNIVSDEDQFPSKKDEFKLHGMSILHEIFKWPYFRIARSHAFGRGGSPVRIVHIDMTLTRSKVNLKVTELLEFRKLPKIALF